MSTLRGRVLTILSVVFSVLILGILFVALREPAKRGGNAPKAKLAVVLVFDQFRGDYLMRWNDLFTEGGFHRLEKDSVWFQNCHYPYANTVTGPGHTSLATGCSPDQHGIVSNDWWDHDFRSSVYCATSVHYQQVPPRKKIGDKEDKEARESGTPERVLAPTLGDALKKATGGKGTVVALSLKDRASCLPGGQNPDQKPNACYWFDTSTGNMVTSTYYRDSVHPWVAEFNAERLVDKWYGKDWTRFRPDLDYDKYSGPDDVAGEGKGIGQGRTFPHPMDGGKPQLGKEYYDALYNSPFGNDLLLALAKRAIDAEKLGQHDVPDVLLLSFSSNDPIGHTWGPDSHEVLDVTLRTDLIVKELLAYLDDKVGKGQYALILSADHGVCPLPEVAKTQGLGGGRLNPDDFKKEANKFLQGKFGTAGEEAQCLDAFMDCDLYLNHDWLQKRHLEQSKVEEALAAWAVKQDGVHKAYTRTQLAGTLPDDDEIGQRVQKSFFKSRSGDVLLVLKPYYFPSKYATGTTHGSPHPYDTHVPLLAMGPGIQPGVSKDLVTPQAGVMILSRALGIAPPAKADAELPKKVFAD